MTHVTFSQQQLQQKTIEQLRQTYAEIGCTVAVQDKRRRESWIRAITQYQANKIQKIAQSELNSHLATQAEAIASEFTTVEINDHHFEIYAGKWLVAYISYDYSDFITQRWVVMVNGEEVFRHSTQAQCHRYINWHYKDGSLNPQPSADVPEVPFISEVCFFDQEALVGGELIASITYNHDNHQNPYWQVIINDLEIFRDITPARCHSYIKQQYQAGTLPVQEPFEEPCTDNRTMAHIFNECQKYGFEPLDDGIYKGDVKLGEVGYTNGNWWVIKGCSGQQYSDSVFDAVRSLLVLSDCEQLLDQPFEMLTAQDWQRLREYEPVSELVAA
ncbi:hypothetical protein [Aulosira sp. FACHB-615]|uniref:hypothetical protein n=1 Tax=Aulosira sp. FACHB-615 TaxID=2692777 RepID=UPI0016825F44|nr:hypothetical protein [Aulosira sp. FACHB-615]MBD2492316.1 hypothetical protein [Aulosira sp. FACHB-615]